LEILKKYSFESIFKYLPNNYSENHGNSLSVLGNVKEYWELIVKGYQRYESDKKYFMTLKFPKPSFLDQMLRLIGKKRGIIIPSDSFNKHGEYVYFFWKKGKFFCCSF